jgi:hypothetical protein
MGGIQSSFVTSPHRKADNSNFEEQLKNNQQINFNDLDTLKYYFEALGLEICDVQLIYELYSNIPEPRTTESVLLYINESENKFLIKYLKHIEYTCVNFKDFVILIYYFVTISSHYCKYSACIHIIYYIHNIFLLYSTCNIAILLFDLYTDGGKLIHIYCISEMLRDVNSKQSIDLTDISIPDLQNGSYSLAQFKHFYFLNCDTLFQPLLDLKLKFSSMCFTSQTLHSIFNHSPTVYNGIYQRIFYIPKYLDIDREKDIYTSAKLRKLHSISPYVVSQTDDVDMSVEELTFRRDSVTTLSNR